MTKIWIRYGNRREERACIGMTRSGKQRGVVGLFNNHAKAHDGDATRQILHGGNVERHEEKRGNRKSSRTGAVSTN